jgi:hypothetical protein
VLCLPERRGKGLGKPGVSGSSSPSDDNSFVSAVTEALGRRDALSEVNELTVLHPSQVVRLMEWVLDSSEDFESLEMQDPTIFPSLYRLIGKVLL